MMRVLLLLGVALTVARAATIIDSSECTEYPCLIFEDEFDYLDLKAWEHEITLGGGGNWEFQAYVNNRSVSYTHDSTLFIKPALTADWKGEEFLTTGTFDFWGAQGRNERCTGNAFYGCERVGASGFLNPILSARLRTLPFVAMRYGRVEIRAKMPEGAWIWPAMWMLPQYNDYGLWPASGEVDIVESRGNADYGTLGNQYAASTLHWGPAWNVNKYDLTHAEYSTDASVFHTWAMEWDESSMKFYHDDVEVLAVDPGTNFWDFGGLESTGYENPWRYGGKMSPFDQNFFFILNVAVGGVNGFFPDEVTSNPPKPWSNTEGTASASFWAGKDSWLPTWEHGEGKISELAALQVDSIRLYKLADN